MNAQQAENLRILIRHMETKVTRRLDMKMYFDSCGTPACALGEAAVCPALAHTGIGKSEWMLTDYGHLFFEIDDRSRGRLFGSRMCNEWKRDDVTASEWALEARKVLAEHGYSMDEPKADTWAEEKVKQVTKVHVEPVAPQHSKHL